MSGRRERVNPGRVAPCAPLEHLEQSNSAREAARLNRRSIRFNFVL